MGMIGLRPLFGASQSAEIVVSGETGMAIKLPCVQKKSDIVASFLRELPMGIALQRGVPIANGSVI